MCKFLSTRSLFPRLPAHPGSWALVSALLLFCACTFDTAGLKPVSSNNATCGNGVHETGERCDGGDLAGQTCVSQGFESGVLTCASNCAAFNTTACVGTGPVCGNGTLETGEVCDGADLADQTCLSRGFDGGTLTCAAGCAAFNTTACEGTGPVCGNGTLETGEVCDGGDLADESCQTQGFVGGMLLCAQNCLALDTTACTGQVCNNGTLEGTEVCDGTTGITQTCEDLLFFGGTLTCSADCLSLDTSGCTLCGNEQVDDDEVCDGTAGITQTCEELGCRSGQVRCAADCLSFTTASCYSGHDEDNDGVDDNCDNCPTISNPGQTDTDLDGLGNLCEAPAGDNLLNRFATFDPFLSATGQWDNTGGTWTPGADHVTGESLLGGNYLHSANVSGATFGVEASFYYPEGPSAGENWTAVIFGYQTGFGGLQSVGWLCAWERDVKEVAVFKYTTGWTKQNSTGIATSAAGTQWRRLRAIYSSAGVRCIYADETGATGSIIFTDSNSIGTPTGKAGLRVANEKAAFTSFITYQ